MIDFVEIAAPDGSLAIALRSGPSAGRDLLLHVHGYGGDHYSNGFVRALHRALPAIDWSFASFPLRTAHYVTESYSDALVSYQGSAIVPPDEALVDLDAAIEHFRAHFERVWLQGHSFGTNLVREYALRSTTATLSVAGLVLLAPADSLALLDTYEGQVGTPRDDEAPASSPSHIYWSRFGVATHGRQYPIPISHEVWEKLRSSPVFTTWTSRGAFPGGLPVLVVRSQRDPIAKFGVLADLAASKRFHRSAEWVEVAGNSHTFSGAEPELVRTVLGWLQRRTS